MRASHIIGNEPFAVLLADDLIDCPDKPCLKQMCEVYQETNASIIAVEEITAKQTRKYGVVALAEQNPHCNRIHAIFEKPQPEDAPFV